MEPVTTDSDVVETILNDQGTEGFRFRGIKKLWTLNDKYDPVQRNFIIMELQEQDEDEIIWSRPYTLICIWSDFIFCKRLASFYSYSWLRLGSGYLSMRPYNGSPFSRVFSIALYTRASLALFIQLKIYFA